MSYETGELPMGADARVWQIPPYNRWAFWNLDHILPGRVIPRSLNPRPLATAAVPGLLQTPLTDTTGAATTVAEVFERSYTDAYVVVRDDTVVAEWYGGTGGPHRPHAIMSITKSVVGCVAGGLVEDGLLDTTRPVTAFIPELIGTGYDGATVRDVLDMRTSVRFREDYLDPTSEIAQMSDWLGWTTPYGEARPPGLYGFLRSLRAGGTSGRFVYRSTDTDVLGWVCERVTGVPMDIQIRDRIWQPMGAESDARMLCDTQHTFIHDGGLAVTARDLARFGHVIAKGGVEPDGDYHVIPPRWLRQVWTVDAEVRAGFAASPSEAAMPGGWYRNQFWVRPSSQGHDVLLGIGIYGQMLFVDRTTGTVGVKFSSWPVPQIPAYLEDTFRAFAAIAAGSVTSRRRRS
jgi:CubicO group peptidase (beta-lactamase class C family)